MPHTALLLIASLVGCFSFLGCNQEQQIKPDAQYGEHHAQEPASSIVRLDMHKVFHTGLVIEPVQRKTVAVPLILTGKVEFDERRVAHVTSRLTGRVEKLHVVTNDHVLGGAVLAEVYSQEFLSMQYELLQAAERLHRVKESSGDEWTAAQSLYRSARKRLAVVGMTDSELSTIESSKAVQTFYLVRAPFAATILSSAVRAGSVLQTGTDLFEIADLTSLWVLADVYESDLSHISEGMKVEVGVKSYPEKSFPGVITTLYSVVDEQTRTVKARVELRNDRGRLKPEMFCTIRVHTEFGKEVIKVPSGALLGETEKHFVFVVLNDTTFEKRDVRTGVETKDFSEILDGLQVGEKIVVKGGFFLKSELAKETFGEDH